MKRLYCTFYKQKKIDITIYKKIKNKMTTKQKE